MYDLGFLRYPEFVAADALDYPELLRRAIRRGAWIHTTSDFVRDEVVATFPVPAERVVRVYPGVPPVHGGDAANGRTLAGTTRYVLAVGTIEPRKNYPVLVRAFDALAADDPDLRLVVARHAGLGQRRLRRRAHRRQPPRPRARARVRVGRRPRRPARRRRRCSRSPRTTRASASRRSRPWPPTSRWWRPAPVPSPRWSATPHCLVDPDDADALADALRTVLTDDATRRDLVVAGPRTTRRVLVGPDGRRVSSTSTGRYAVVKAVVTGARGFVGRHLTRHLTARHVDVVSLDVDDAQPVDITDRRRGGAPHRGGVTRRRVPPRGAQPRRRVVDRRRPAHAGERRRHARGRRRMRRGRRRARARRRQRRAVRHRRPRRDPGRRAHRVPTDQSLREEQGRRGGGRARRAPDARARGGVHARVQPHRPGPVAGVPRPRSGGAHRRGRARRDRRDHARQRRPVRDFSDVRDVVRAYALLADTAASPARSTTCARAAVCASATSPRV